MTRDGCLLLLLPDQRATSAIASSAALSTGSSVTSRIWRVCRSGGRRSAGLVVTRRCYIWLVRSGAGPPLPGRAIIAGASTLHRLYAPFAPPRAGRSAARGSNALDAQEIQAAIAHQAVQRAAAQEPFVNR